MKELLSNDDHLQHHLRPDIILFSQGCISNGNATQHRSPANYYRHCSAFCLTPSAQAAEYASETIAMQRMQPDVSHLILRHKCSGGIDAACQR